MCRVSVDGSLAVVDDKQNLVGTRCCLLTPIDGQLHQKSHHNMVEQAGLHVLVSDLAASFVAASGCLVISDLLACTYHSSGLCPVAAGW